MSAGAAKRNDLPEREVPGHNGEDGADGTVADEAFFGSSVDDFVSQDFFGILGVVAAGVVHLTASATAAL